MTIPTSTGGQFTNAIGATQIPTKTIAGPPSMGVQTPSPQVKTSNPPPITTNTTDLSNQYANVNGTIYNKSNGQAYSTPQQFFSASGQNSFNNLKFDTSWTPSTSTLEGLQAPTENGQSVGSNSTSNGLLAAGSTGQGTLGSLPAQTSSVNTSSASPTNSSGLTTSQDPSQTSAAYPNAYTGTQSSNPTYATLSNQAQQLSTPSQQEIDLANQIAQFQNTTTQAETGTSTVGDLEGATGRESAINQSAQSTLQSLQNQLTNLQQQRQDALKGIQDQITTLTPISAASGTTLINPATGSTIASTNQLTQNLVGAPVPFNPSTGLIGQGATGGGTLGTPTNASNVPSNIFSAVSSVLNQLGSNDQQSNNFISTAVQQALANGGNPPANLTSQQAQVVQQVLSQMNPSYSSNAAAGAGAALQSNAQVGGTAAVNAGNSLYQTANPAYQTLANVTVPNIEAFGNLLTQGAGGINPFSSQFANDTLQQFQSQLSSSQQGQFQSTFQQLKQAIAALAGAGGTQTPTANSSQSDATLSPTAKLSTIQDVLTRIAAEGKQYLTTAAALSNQALSQAQGGSSTSTSAPAGFGWSGN
jgi:hypothetical protein